MRDAPDFPLAALLALQTEYGLHDPVLEFLPWGADQDVAVYRVTVEASSQVYFLKARRGAFDEVAVRLPKLLHDQGIPQIIAPLPTQTGHLWARRAGVTLILYPFVTGHNDFDAPLTDRQWRDLGAAVRRIHDTPLPADLWDAIPQVSYDTDWGARVDAFLASPENQPAQDGLAEMATAFLRAHAATVRALIAQTDRLARRLQAAPPPQVVCHTDLHAANLLLPDAPPETFYIVDWDAPLRAPKERDLMFPGSGMFGGAQSRADQEQLFMAGYGAVEVHREALHYFRGVRILEDLALYGEQIYGHADVGAERQQALQRIQANFAPGGTIAAAWL